VSNTLVRNSHSINLINYVKTEAGRRVAEQI
jgi:hypothetical protein